MEDGRSGTKLGDQGDNAPEKGSKKDRKSKSKSSSKRSKKKESKESKSPSPPSRPHSTLVTDEGESPQDRDLAERGAHGGQGDSVTVKEGVMTSNVEEMVAREESPIKRDHSKSRSRSGSRSRFSGFFKRKKRSKSETDLNEQSKNERAKQYDSAEDVKKKHLSDLTTEVSGTPTPLRSNLKRTSPHHSYDSRVQPRDRLKNMTVRDAVREQRLKRADSAQRTSRQRDMSGSGDVSMSTSSVMFTSSPSLQGEMSTSVEIKPSHVHQDGSTTLPKLKRKRSHQSEPEVSSFPKCSSFPKFTQSMTEDTPPSITSLGRQREEDRTSLPKDVGMRDVADATPKMYVGDLQDTGVDHSQSPDAMNDGEDTKTLVNVSLSSQDEENVAEPIGQLPVKPATEEDDMEAKMKRKTSLSQFLELRQSLPSAFSRPRLVSQSSDSGVTSRDTSPSGSIMQRSLTLGQNTKPTRQDSVSAEKPGNPYVISSVPISPSRVTAPRLSLNGTEVDDDSQPDVTSSIPSVTRPSTIKLGDSMGESSSISSSPQVNSMTSSFRSSDQGYADSGGDSSEEEFSFSTPPEEVEPSATSRSQNRRRNITPGVLKKLLEKEEQSQKRDFPELAVETWDDKTSRFLDKAIKDLEESNMTGTAKENEKEKEPAEPRYVPRGVRRSKSDVDSHAKSPRRYHRQFTNLSDAVTPQTKLRAGSAEAVVHASLGQGRVTFDEDGLSATSTATLTNFDLPSQIGGDQVSIEKTEQKPVPVMGTAAQQKYRRTFSPSRQRKFIPAIEVGAPMAPEPPVSSTIAIPEESSPSIAAPVVFSKEPKHLQVQSDTTPSPSPTKVELSPAAPKRGILKSPSRERSSEPKLKGETSAGTQPTKKEKTPDSTTKKMDDKAIPDVIIPITEIIVANAEEAGPKVTTPVEKSGKEIISPIKPTFTFPMIHGLEVGLHRDPSFSGYSLSDYLQEQSKAFWKRQTSPVPPEKKGKESKFLKKSFKRKAKVSEEVQRTADSSKSSPTMKETAQQQEKEITDVTGTVKPTDESKFKIMVDKECQTSAWLITTLVRKKTKLKKKVHSFSKKKKRRDSVVSDTFIPTETKKNKEAFHRSSLGDIRKASASAQDLTKEGMKALKLPPRIGRRSPEKKVSRLQGKSAKRAADLLRAESVSSAGSSCQRRDLEGAGDDTSDTPKTKKISLTAIILLKNRLAKFRDKKRLEKAAAAAQEEELVESEVPSDTFITIENELNLSKLEVSKETDIIDDDIFEPEFSLDYTKKQLRFEPLPPSEPMQSEEPLPPLPSSTSRRMRQRRESTMRERRRKCVQYCKKFVAFLFSHIGLCSLVVAYTIMGGFIFQALEENSEYSVRSTIKDKREKVVSQLVALAVEFQKTERGMENLTGEVNVTVKDYQEFIHGVTKDRGWDGVEGVDEESLWTFASSLLYAITVTTTIGYGHVAPKTPEGRIVTIGYAVVGIPLTLLCLTNIGDVMATGFRLLYGKVCCGICCTMFKPRRRRIPTDLEKGLGRGAMVTTEEEQSDKPKEVIHVPTSLCLLLIAAYIFAGAMLFSEWEGWDILTGSYFCFITLSTIGFGDIVPGMESNAWAHEEKLVLCALYLVLGLSLIAMCFNLVQEDVKAKCRWLGMKLGIVDRPEPPV